MQLAELRNFDEKTLAEWREVWAPIRPSLRLLFRNREVNQRNLLNKPKINRLLHSQLAENILFAKKLILRLKNLQITLQGFRIQYTYGESTVTRGRKQPHQNSITPSLPWNLTGSPCLGQRSLVRANSDSRWLISGNLLKSS